MSLNKKHKKSSSYQKTLLLEIIKLLIAALIGCLSIPSQYFEHHKEGYCEQQSGR